MNRFLLPDLGGGEATPDSERNETMVFEDAASSIGDVGDLALTVQLELNNTCEELRLPVPSSEQSTGKDGPQESGAGLDEEVYLIHCIWFLSVEIELKFK